MILPQLRDTLRDQWQPMAAFMLLLFSVEVVRGWTAADYDWTDLAHYAVADIGPIFAALGTAALLGPVIAAACCRNGWLRALLTVVLTVAAVRAGIEVLHWLSAGPISAAVRDGRVLSDDAFALRSLWFYSAAGLLFAGYCSVRERHMAITRATQAAEFERAAVQRAVMESRLKVLQARVEPDFLFGSLDQLDALYRRSPAAAERMLDDLIHYLRAALPRMHGDGTTVGHEIELVRAYLDVLQVPRGKPVTLTIDCTPALAAVGFAPMVLLQIVRHWFVGQGADAIQGIAIRVSSGRDELRITISIEGDVATAPLSNGARTVLEDAIVGTCGIGSTLAFAVRDRVHRATIIVPSANRVRDAA